MAAVAKNDDLHGMVPDECPAALLIIDMINDLEFPGGEELLAQVLPAAERLAEFKRRAGQRGIPVIYVNDNFGRWRSDFRSLVRHCLDNDVRGRPLVELLAPTDDDYFVLKPKHSGFYATSLELLLTYLNAGTLILTGLAGNSCVLFTALDAFMRDYHLYVPADCVASINADDNERAVAQMKAAAEADIRPSTAIDLEALLSSTREGAEGDSRGSRHASRPRS